MVLNMFTLWTSIIQIAIFIKPKEYGPSSWKQKKIIIFDLIELFKFQMILPQSNLDNR